MNWKTVNYRVHRWLGIVLGSLTFVWFASGIAMIYYPWPAPTPSEDLARLQPFSPPAGLIGFDSATAIAHQLRAAHDARGAEDAIAGGRLSKWNGRPVYALARQHGSHLQPAVLVDAASGRVLSPITPDDAISAARAALPSSARGAHADNAELLASGDHYLLSNEYAPGFPAYRVRFDDDARTAVYVSRDAGYVVGIVDTRARWTTWLGTVPHWLYFKWLYTRHIGWWLWASYVLPGLAAIAGVSGIVIGLHQLLPHWRRGEWRISAYHGASQWHHLAGIIFGALVLTWSVSGLLEVLGPDATATASQLSATLGVSSERAAISELDASRHAAAVLGTTANPIAIDRRSLLGRPGFVVHFPSSRRAWVDAVTGAARQELTGAEAARIATTALGDSSAIGSVTRISRYDTYYYARFHRELPLPAYRVSFADAEHSSIYIDPVSGEAIGFVTSETRAYRWLRDGLHSLDFPALNDRRRLWTLVILPLMLGGTAVAATGLWLAARRTRRMLFGVRASGRDGEGHAQPSLPVR